MMSNPTLTQAVIDSAQPPTASTDFAASRTAGVAVPMPETKPRVVVCTAHTTDYAPLADLTVPLMRAYCERHGYDFYYEPHYEQRIANDGDRMKVRIYEELYLTQKYDVYMWIDSDALIMNGEPSVEDILRHAGAKEQHHFLWGYDVGGPNSGVYFARFTPEGSAFMKTQLARSTEMGWGDNTAMIQVSLVPPHSETVLCVPGKLFNAYLMNLYGWERYSYINGYETGCFILHLPGLPQERRIAIATEMAKLAT